MPKPKHRYAVGDKVRVTEEGIAVPLGTEFTVESIHYSNTDGGWGPFYYKGAGEQPSEYVASGLVKDPGVWERFLEPASADDAKGDNA